MNAITKLERNALQQRPPSLGLPRLMQMAFDGQSLTDLAQTLIARANTDPEDANALMDLAMVLQLQGQPQLGLATLDLALQASRCFQQPSTQTGKVKLLALMARGDLMANAPVQFLLENSDIALEMFYLLPGEPIPEVWPEHDVALVAMSESPAARELLQQLGRHIDSRALKVLLHPQRIRLTCRDQAASLLAGTPGLQMPPTVEVMRLQLLQLCAGALQPQDLLGDAPMPWIIRPVDSHAGHGLEKIDSLADLNDYLAGQEQHAFFVSPFVDYRSRDGLYRKYRVVLVDGQPFAGHMGISAHWMVHYLNAGMTQNPAKRAEEAQFMVTFDQEFAPRHALALRGIHQRLGLEYLVIDCAQTAQGELLVFEVDPGAVVHAMDPTDLFPYKPAAMQKVFDAFCAMVLRHAA